MLTFFLLEKNEIINFWNKWKRNDFVSFKRQIFIPSINNYSFNYQIVISCLGIACSYYVTTVGANNKPVQNSQWYWLIQPRSVSTWPILYPTLVNEFPQRLTNWLTTLVNFLFSFVRGQTKQVVEKINSFPSLKLSKHEIVSKQYTTFFNQARDNSKRYVVTKAFFALKGRTVRYYPIYKSVVSHAWIWTRERLVSCRQC